MQDESIKPILDKLCENTEILRKDVSGLKEDVSTLKEDVSGLKKDSITLREHSITLREHSATLDKYAGSLKEHSEEIASIHRSLVVIEDAVTNKIPALFDAFLANQEKHEEYDKELEHLETVTQKNSIRISVLENTSEMHSKKLAKLSS